VNSVERVLIDGNRARRLAVLQIVIVWPDVLLERKARIACAGAAALLMWGGSLIR